MVPVVFATSAIDRSTSSPGPPRRTTRLRGQRGDRGVEAAHPLHRAAAHLHRRAARRVPRTASAPLSAWSVSSVAGRPAYGPVEAVGRDRHDDQLREALVQRGRDRRRCRVGASVIRMSAPASELASSSLRPNGWWRRSSGGRSGGTGRARRRRRRPAPVPVAAGWSSAAAGSPSGDSTLTRRRRRRRAAWRSTPRDARRAVDHLQIREQIHRAKGNPSARSQTRATWIAWAGC